MTNGEKYLKDGVDVEELAHEIMRYELKEVVMMYPEKDADRIARFFEEQVKPTLSEDEKVILRNIDKGNYDRIGVLDDCLYIKGDFDCDKDIFHYMYHGLFKFIQERRRI